MNEYFYHWNVHFVNVLQKNQFSATSFQFFVCLLAVRGKDIVLRNFWVSYETYMFLIISNLWNPLSWILTWRQYAKQNSLQYILIKPWFLKLMESITSIFFIYLFCVSNEKNNFVVSVIDNINNNKLWHLYLGLKIMLLQESRNFFFFQKAILKIQCNALKII